jgi:hypothetical protein
MGAAADCEIIGPGFLGQPINSLTTFAFVVAGAVLIAVRRDRRWVGIGLVATGVGSFVFHGPMPPGSEWAHDVTLAWLIAIVGGVGSRWERFSRLPALVVLAIAFALVPAIADPVTLVMTALALLTVLGQDRSRRVLAPLIVLAVIAGFGRLGATGAPLCDPESILQPHGAWHIGSALTVAWWAVVYSNRSTTRR